MSGLDEKSAGLLAAMVDQNVRDLAFTNDRIQDALRDARDFYAESFLKLYMSLANIPEMSRTVYVEKLLDRFAHVQESASEIRSPFID